MKRISKIIFWLGIISICIITLSESSSAITQMVASRDSSMRVVDSEKALISLPSEIALSVKVIKSTINYYDLVQCKANEKTNKDTLIINDVNYKKVLDRSEEKIEIIDLEHNLVIKNNTTQDITLKDAKLEIPYFYIDDHNDTLSKGASKKLLIQTNSSYSDSDILTNLSNEQNNSNITLDFNWPSGDSTLYLNMCITLDINNETIEVINKEAKVN